MTKHWIQSFYQLVFFQLAQVLYFLIVVGFIDLSLCISVFEWILLKLSINNAVFTQKHKKVHKLRSARPLINHLKNKYKTCANWKKDDRYTNNLKGWSFWLENRIKRMIFNTAQGLNLLTSCIVKSTCNRPLVKQQDNSYVYIYLSWMKKGKMHINYKNYCNHDSKIHAEFLFYYI